MCTRTKLSEINAIADTVRSQFPNSILHGFGVKVASNFDSTDSMAWSIHERKHKRNGNCWRAAQKYADKVTSLQTT